MGRLDFSGFPYVVKKPTFVMYLERMASLDHSKVTKVVWHHTGNRNFDVTATSTNRYHIDGRGWAGIGYHMMVRWSGLVELGRPMTKRGAHAKYANSVSFGVCLSGNFDLSDGSLRPDQYRSAVLLARLFNQAFPGIKHVRHMDVGATACNGKLFPWARFINDIYEEESDVRARYHAVVRGDTFGKIALHHKVSRDNLGTWNPHIVDQKLIRAEFGGDVIFLEQANDVNLDWASERNRRINYQIENGATSADFEQLITEKNLLLDESIRLNGVLDTILDLAASGKK